MRRALLVGVLVGLGTFPAAAAGADRYAGPAGSGSEPCLISAPCSIQTAFSGASSGDTIWLLPGDYGSSSSRISSTLSDGGNQLTIRGLGAATARPKIWSSAQEGVWLSGTGSSMSDVVIDDNGPSSGDALLLQATASITRVTAIWDGGNDSEGCLTQSTPTVTISDSECVATSPGTDAMMAQGPLVAAGDTFYAAGDANSGLYLTNPGGTNVSVIDTIMHGTNESDVYNQGNGGSVTISRSNFSSETGTIADGGGNQSVPPKLVDPAGGDFRETLDSPTVDAGVPDAALGSEDVFGLARTQGSAPDIGAHEYVPSVPSATTGAAAAVTPTGASVGGTVNPNDQSTSYVFEYGTTTAYGSTTAPASAGAGTTNQDVAASLSGLMPGTRYHYRLVATNGSGTARGDDATFTTGPAPPTPAGQCANGIDDDHDGFVDGADPQCQAGRGVEAPADNPVLVCSRKQLVLEDVVRASHRRVRFLGVTERDFAGRTVSIVSGGRRVASVRVRADGTFSGSAAAPRSGAARFQARMGAIRSLSLKLARRMQTSSAALHGGTVVLAGRVTGRLPHRLPTVALLAQRNGCSKWTTVGHAKLHRNGTFRVTARRFTDVVAAVYRARVRIAHGHSTYTLPRAIAFGP